MFYDFYPNQNYSEDKEQNTHLQYVEFMTQLFHNLCRFCHNF